MNMDMEAEPNCLIAPNKTKYEVCILLLNIMTQVPLINAKLAKDGLITVLVSLNHLPSRFTENIDTLFLYAQFFFPYLS